jgi:hypothetical protein
MRQTYISDPVTITFDDIPKASTTNGAFPEGYKNLKWLGLSYIYEDYAKTKFRNSGYTNAFKIGGSQYVAFCESSAAISVENPNQVFDVISLETCAARTDHVELTITGCRSGVQVHRHTWKLLLGKPQHIHLHWTNIDGLILQSSGENQHRGSRSSASFFILTALTINGPR